MLPARCSCSECGKQFRFVDFLLIRMPPIYFLKCRHCENTLKVSRAVFYFASLSWPVTGMIVTIMLVGIGGLVWPFPSSEIFRSVVLVLAFSIGMIVGSYVFLFIFCSWVKAEQQKPSL